MAINKKLIHFKNFSDFNSKKLSANENNTQYTLGISGAVTNGSPDILYQSICYIKDTKQQWTHGQLYDGTNLNESGFLAGEETSDQLDDVETNTYVKYVPQTLTNEQKAQTRINIGAVSEDNFKTINGESVLGSGNITISGGGSEKEYVEVDGRQAINFHSRIRLFEPNKIYYSTCEVGESVNIYADGVIPPTENVGEYTLYFTTGAMLGPIPLEVPAEWLWANGTAPNIEEGVTYELSVCATKLGNDYIYKACLTPFKPVE
jgi:hypothetical protein